MNYQETLQYLYSQLPYFTRDGPSAYKADLTNTIALCSRLGDPQHKFKSIHIGGTNGKGSTSHMLAAILQTAGYKTGLYTSPHLKDFRERVRINGEMITEQDVVDFVADHQRDFDEVKPSFFEMTVALAFDTFARQNVDIAIIEVGLGGRLDSTNIISPLVSVITNIGWDHMNILGNTLQLIAAEKAGIIKHDIPVIIGEKQPEVSEVFVQKANATGSRLTFASDEWEAHKLISQGYTAAADGEYIEIRVEAKPTFGEHALEAVPADYHLKLDLTGSYQLKNVKTALSAVKELNRQGFGLTTSDIETALRQVKKLTGLKGRWQILNHSPLTICDTGHNPEGIREVLNNIAGVKYEQLHFVIGIVNDKDISQILGLLPATATYYFCKPNNPRALEAKTLMERANGFGLNGEAYASVMAALSAAQRHAATNDLVFVGGSTFVVAEVV